MSESWRDIYCEREEIELLLACYERVAKAEPEPQIVVLTGAPGLGKTRLVQRFYELLVQRYDIVGFWPKALARVGTKLDIMPPLSDAPQTAIAAPFLWWGLGFSDPKINGAPEGSVVRGALGQLSAYLRPLHAAREKRGFLERGGRLAVDAIGLGLPLAWDATAEAIAALSGGATTTGAGSLARDIIRHSTDQSESPRQVARVADDQVLDAIVEDISAVMDPATKAMAVTPMVLVLDDIHFSQGKELASRLVDRLARAASDSDHPWPLMIVATCWNDRWMAEIDDPDRPGIIGLFQPGEGGCPPCVAATTRTLGGHPLAPFPLAGVDDLDRLSRSALPGLTDPQHAALRDKADGSPQYMEDAIRLFLGNLAYFQDRDPTRALSDGGETMLRDRLIKGRIESVLAPRLRDLPDTVKLVLQCAAAQGIGFDIPTTLETARELGAKAPPENALETAVSPEAFVEFAPDGSARFSYRHHFDVVLDFLREVPGEFDRVTAALHTALDRLLTAPPSSDGTRPSILANFKAISIWADEPERRDAVAVAHARLAPMAYDADQSAAAGVHVEKAIPTLLSSDRAARALTAWDWISFCKTIAEVKTVPSAATVARRAMPFVEPDAEVTRDRHVFLSMLGDMETRLGNLPDALSAHEKVRDGMRARASDDDPSSLRDLSISLNKIGDVKSAQGDLDGALDAFQEGKDIREALAKRDPNRADWQRDLSVSLSKIGDVKSAEGDLDGALDAFQEGMKIAEALAKRDPNRADWQRDLSVSLERIGDVKSAQGDLDGALDAFLEGKDIREALAKRDPSRADWQRDLSVSLERLAQLHLLKEERAAAWPLLEDAVARRRAVLARGGPGEFSFDLASTCLQALFATPDEAAARRMYDLAVETLRPLVEARVEHPRLARLLEGLARISEAGAEADGA